MNMKYQRNTPPPPPPSFRGSLGGVTTMKLISPGTKVLLCVLFLIAFLAVPVQSQSVIQNPGAANLLACGLPTANSEFTTAATYRTFELTADCDITSSMVSNNGQYLYFRNNSGEFTINGNGYTISGPSNATLFIVGEYNLSEIGAVTTPRATLNLNDVTISAVADTAPYQSNTPILVHTGGRFNVDNVTFSGNGGEFNMEVRNNSTAYLTDIQFLNNHSNGLTMHIRATGLSAAQISNTLLVITNSRFEGNTGAPNILIANRATIQLRGCIIFRDNVDSANQPAANWGSTQGGMVDDGTINQGNRSRCPQPKRKKRAEASPTPTPRPAYGAAYVALQTATGMTFEATYGLDSGVHFRHLDGAGIGVQSIIDAGYLAALDVYGYVEQGVEVCFPQIGRVLFLDARTMPRTITPLESTVVNGMTCASISSPGSLVLMPN